MDLGFQNVQGGADDQEENSADAHRKRSDVQRDIIMQESDYRKKLTKKTEIEAEIRKMKKDEERIRIEIGEKREALEKLNYEILQMEAEMTRLKKKLNLIKG